MTNLDKVRKALEQAFESATGYVAVDLVRDAMSALTAHEQEVAELVEALTFALSYVEDAMNDPGYKSGAVAKTLKIVLSALRPFTGDEK